VLLLLYGHEVDRQRKGRGWLGSDDVVPFGDSEELLRNSGLPASALVEVGDDNRLADPEPLRKMLAACEGAAGGSTPSPTASSPSGTFTGSPGGRGIE
jgi:hypothetical protein